MLDIVVIGAGPAGIVAALRAADLGARTALVTCDEFGGMAKNDRPVPMRTIGSDFTVISHIHSDFCSCCSKFSLAAQFES